MDGGISAILAIRDVCFEDNGWHSERRGGNILGKGVPSLVSAERLYEFRRT